ncbi:aminotransferase class V-fold PLP-dependent enzyme [Mycoplasmopsis caviae]|uniref:Aminotransferase class V-fold PLP-dependent enzyme n=1 Tax=Mycoplasmopsis caviae TaxID=55603 RepID=A0A3P8MEM3_9BACT|nr:aminotransferase class V-fold PLP-dependent enzyme [Mycoplasmopsis caviae]UUD35241.1 aminotransferase class V-fold PLP-dependent enzyme [Mycoplasmopsis caviae]VDR41976.1 Soluble hydrogenase 42 kDa subunit [Mycoplasmopsis caviae]
MSLPHKKNICNYKTKVLFTPGPINNYYEVAKVLSDVSIHHRSEEFKSYFIETGELIKKHFGTTDAMPLFLTVSASGAMEASIVNLVEPGNKVLLVECGFFGKRFKDILLRLVGKDYLDVIHYENGQAFNPEDIKEKLKKCHYKAIFMTHHETSTGVLNNMNVISKLIKEYAKDSLFILDTVSSFLHEEIHFDKWELDVAMATSGKGFCTLPGLSCILLSKRAQSVAKNNKNFKFYFDFAKYIDFHNEGSSTPFTPATTTLMSLYASLKIIEQKGIETIRSEKKKIFNFMKKSLIKLGFASAVQEENETHGLLVLAVPESVDAFELRKKVDEKYNLYFELGIGSQRKTHIRIGIPNTINMFKAKKLVYALKEVLAHWKS